MDWIESSFWAKIINESESSKPGNIPSNSKFSFEHCASINFWNESSLSNLVFRNGNVLTTAQIKIKYDKNMLNTLNIDSIF